MIQLSRRGLITGLGGIFAACVAPPIVRAANIMAVKPIITPMDQALHNVFLNGGRPSLIFMHEDALAQMRQLAALALRNDIESILLGETSDLADSIYAIAPSETPYLQ